MERIASFCIDHTKLMRGMYISRIDSDIVTYDIRMRRPNVEPVMDTGTMHTIEHLFATKARNSSLKDKVIYFGPMGCRTGFYLIMKDTEHSAAIDLTREIFAWISDYNGEIPGATPVECGNYSDQNLAGANNAAGEMVEVLANWSAEMLKYC